jgi:hypothetical protein
MGRPSHVANVSLLDRVGDALNAHAAKMMRGLGDWESLVLRENIAQVRIDRPVYICGVARAGSTLLLELLNAAPGFTSHRYADYPFLWTPYWWNALRARLNLPKTAPTERAHRDRVAVTFESPEAFEEVLWMSFFPGRHDPAVDQVLDSNVENAAFDAFYASHIRKLLAVRGASRYLAKGNYNLARIGYLARLFPGARFVVAVREPQAHVASLLKQDRLFCELVQRNPAVANHLASSGHFEFGPHKRALNTGDDEVVRRITACFAAGRLVEAYALQWAASYERLMTMLNGDPCLAQACLLVDYDDLCASARPMLAKVFAHVGVPGPDARYLVDKNATRITKPEYYRANISKNDANLLENLTGATWQKIRRSKE